MLDLDETLIHYEEPRNDYEEGIVLVRPGAQDFLKEMALYFELVIFTAGQKDVRFLVNLSMLTGP